MNEVINVTSDENTKDKTLIEIALQVDENGWTTAKKLYDWLEMDPGHYAEWVKERILDNKYVDKMEFSPLGGKTSEKGGRPLQDYAISGNLAKMLATSSKSSKGELARKYFVKLEDALKISIQQYNELVNAFNEHLADYNELKQQLSEVKKLVLVNTPPTPPPCGRMTLRISFRSTGIPVRPRY